MNPETDAESSMRFHKEVDTRGEVCPFPWVHAAKSLKKMAIGEILHVLGDHGPALRNIPENFTDAGQTVLSAESMGGIEWEIFVRKEQ